MRKIKAIVVTFLREINEQTTSVSDELLDIPEIAKAVHLAEQSAYSKAELAFYESYWDQVRRENTLFSEKYSEGETKGRTEGFAEGLSKKVKRKVKLKVWLRAQRQS